MTDSPSTEPMAGIPNPGEVLVGKYRVERVLGVGGMGAVVAATHLQLEEKVAIKFLHATTAVNADSVARFLREGKAVIKIRSEHAVKVHDVGRLENGAPYLVMEHLEGSDLEALLQKNGPLAASDVVDMILQGCEAIAEGHTLGIIHRDLKPANLFLTQRADGSPCVKVLDFGISKAASSQNVVMTRTQTVMGSPRYMSPEQMRSTRAVDARTDVWSLGIILYELLSGAPPFNGESMTELCAQILQDAPTPLPRISPRVVPQLDAVVQRCLAKDPDQRFTNLAEFATALCVFGSASARASTERIVRLMQARSGASGGVGATKPSLVSSPALPNPGPPVAPPVAPTLGSRTPPVAHRTLDGAASTGATTPGKKLALTGVVGLIAVAATIAGVAFTRSREPSPASSVPATTPVAATPVPTPPAPAASPAAAPPTPPEPSALPAPVAPSTASAPDTSSAPATSATPKPKATPAPAPPALTPHKRAASSPPPAATVTDGMFDGRK
jgi:serine/threonine protein kinase